MAGLDTKVELNDIIIWTDADMQRRAAELGKFMITSNENLSLGTQIKVVNEDYEVMCVGVIKRSADKAEFIDWFKATARKYADDPEPEEGYIYFYEVTFD